MAKMVITLADGQVAEVKKYNVVERTNLILGFTGDGMSDLEIQEELTKFHIHVSLKTIQRTRYEAGNVKKFESASKVVELEERVRELEEELELLYTIERLRREDDRSGK